MSKTASTFSVKLMNSTSETVGYEREQDRKQRKNTKGVLPSLESFAF